MTIWGHSKPPPRRPRAPDVSQIVDTAVELADRGGLEAVSLRRVASQLGSGTASLYRVLDSRDELVERMVDAALGQHLPADATGDWQADLAAVARNRRAMLAAHPWLGAELAGRPAIGPNALTHHERALAAVVGYADDPTAVASAVETVLAYVLGAAARESAEARTRCRSGLTHEQWQAAVAPYLQDVLADGGYPHVTRMVREARDLAADEWFERGLSCLIAGLAAQRPAQ